MLWIALTGDRRGREVDPGFQLIKGGVPATFRRSSSPPGPIALWLWWIPPSWSTVSICFLLPVEVLPGAWRQVQQQLADLGGAAELRMAQRKAGPVVTDQGNLVLDVKMNGGIDDPAALERTINNIPGVLENGLFVNLTDEVLVGEIKDGVAGARSLDRVS